MTGFLTFSSHLLFFYYTLTNVIYLILLMASIWATVPSSACP